ncbi:nitrous oxide reductase [Streptacidiphilus sp. MAP12-33]|uniref:hypothetical protein n=1 Tax=Streptacidiphilus sp. MAP12-33 TaxID=3156266 RepID=UPI003519D043
MPDSPDTSPSDIGSPLSRRGLIKHATVAGAATVAAGLALSAAAAGTAAAAEKTAAAPDQREPEKSDEPFMVRVLDPHTGELDIFHGHRHYRVHDRKLVSELLRAAR